MGALEPKHQGRERPKTGWDAIKSRPNAQTRSADPSAQAQSDLEDAADRQRTAANSAAGSQYGFVVERLERGDFSFLRRDEVVEFHNLFLGVYSDCCKDSIPNPRKFILSIDDVETGPSGNETKHKVGEDQIVWVEERFAPKFEAYGRRNLSAELVGTLAGLIDSPRDFVDRTVANLLADKRFLTAYVTDPSRAEVRSRLMENLYRVTGSFAPLTDANVPSKDGPLIQNLARHSGTVSNVAYSPDGAWLVSVGQESSDNLHVWRAETGALVRSVSTGSVGSVAVSADSRRIAVCALVSGRVSWFDPEVGEVDEFVRDRTKGGAKAAQWLSICFGRGGESLWLGDVRGGVSEIDLASKKTLTEFRTSGATVYHLALSADGERLAAMTVGGSAGASVLGIWQAATGERLGQVVAEEQAAFLGDCGRSELFAFGASDGGIEVFTDAGEQAVTRLAGRAEQPSAFAISADKKLLAAGYPSGGIDLWNLVLRERLRSFDAHTKRIRSLAFSPSGDSLVSGAEDRNLFVWRTRL